MKKRNYLNCRFKYLSLLSVLLLLSILLLSESSMGPFRSRLERYLSKVTLESLDPLSSSQQERLLIIAPHPDDETIGSAGIIQKAIQNNDEVRVVLVSNGDGFGDILDETIIAKFRSQDHGLKIGYRRQEESIRALETIGLLRKHITFLGYPDGGLQHLWFENWEKPFYSIHTKSDYSPYNNSFTLSAPYHGQAISKDLSYILEEFQPTLIVTPSYYDFHPDHRASTNFVIAEVEKFKIQNIPWAKEIKIHYYLVHHGKLRWPRPWGFHPKEVLLPPESMLGMDVKWYHSPLNEVSIDIKKNAMDQYTSQIKMIGGYMYAFVRDTELFNIHEWDTHLMMDPSNDYFIKDLIRGGDFVSLRLESEPDHLILQVETFPKGLPGNLSYGLQVVFYEQLANGEIVEHRKKWKFQKKEVYLREDQLQFTIPVQDFTNLYGCFVSLESYDQHHTILIDHFPWSFFRLKDLPLS